MKKETQKGNAGKAKQDSKKPPVTAAGNSASAGKRGTQSKAGSAGKKPAPAPSGGKGQASRSRGGAKAQGVQAAQSPGAKKPEVSIKERKDLVVVTLKFHNDKNGGHHHIIVEDIDDNHVSVGTTTKRKKGKGHTNYPLEISPMGDGKESFVRRQGTVAPKKEYVSPREGKITKNDYTKVKEIGDKAKKKYLDKKNIKK